jgi:predicted transcriptional regulator
MKDISVMRDHIKEMIDQSDEKTVETVLKVLEGDGEDLLENMSPEQEASFLRGLKDADEGRTTRHEEVMKKYEKWLTK